jgi:hypothetical protein
MNSNDSDENFNNTLIKAEITNEDMDNKENLNRRG